MMNKEYIRYEIQERKYSSNIIIGVYLVWNENKKRFEEEKDKVIAPITNKVQGDQYSQLLVNFLNSQSV